jgi:hypothetical protein
MPATRGRNDLYLACITARWAEVPEAYCIHTVTLLRNVCCEKREKPCAARQRSGTGGQHDG